MMTIKWRTTTTPVVIIALAVCLSAVLIWKFGTFGSYAIPGDGVATTSDYAQSGDKLEFLEWRLLPLEKIIMLNEGTSSEAYLTLRLESLGKTFPLQRAAWMKPWSYYKLELVDKSKTSSFDIETLRTTWEDIMDSGELSAKTEKTLQNSIADLQQIQKQIHLNIRNYSNAVQDTSWTSIGDKYLINKLKSDFSQMIAAYDVQDSLLDIVIEERYRTLESLSKKDVLGALRADRDVEAVALVLSWYDDGISSLNTEIVGLNAELEKSKKAEYNALNKQLDGVMSQLQDLQATLDATTTSQ